MKTKVLSVNNIINNNDDKDDRNWFQILAIFISCITSLQAGLLFSWSSPSILKIVADKENYNISFDQASYFTVLPPIGALISSPIFSILGDSIGRKYTLLTIAVSYSVPCILFITTTSLYSLYLSRFITGFGDACLFAVLPTYVGEISTPKVRGTWGNYMTFSIYAGQFLANIIGSYTSIKTTGYFYLTLPIVFACSFPFMPESPYFLLMKGRIDDARAALQRLRQKKNVENELAELNSDVHRQMSETGTWRDVFMIESNRKAVIAGIFLRASQQFGGISTFAVYTQYIFSKSRGSVDKSTSSIIFTGLCMVLNVCAGFTLDKIGRRRSYFLSTFTCGIVLFIEALYFFLDQNFEKIDVQIVNWIPLVGMILFVFFYSFGLGIVPTLMLGELFSASIKGKGLCLLNIVFAILVSSMTKLFQVLDSNFGLFSPFLFFSVSCFISSTLALHFVPETKGKTLEEIQQSLKGGSGAKKQDNTLDVENLK